jgi:hypothetical protein
MIYYVLFFFLLLTVEICRALLCKIFNICSARAAQLDSHFRFLSSFRFSSPLTRVILHYYLVYRWDSLTSIILDLFLASSVQTAPTPRAIALKIN